MNAGTIVTALQIFGRAENGDAESAADANGRTSITSHAGSVGRELGCNYTRRFLRGRQPLCGTGVTSLMVGISRPMAWRARIADSRPEPGPLTRTSISFIPWDMACRAASWATCWAA